MRLQCRPSLKEKTAVLSFSPSDMSTACRIVAALLLLLFDTALSVELSRGELEKRLSQEIYLRNRFHSYVRPYRNDTPDEPVTVSIDLHLLQLAVDSRYQEIDVLMYFREEWNDSRLAYDGQDKLTYILLHDTIGFWSPDLFFVQEKNARIHTVTRPNTCAWVYPDGRVRHSQRISVKSNCPMNLSRYPFDRQKCSLRIESYGYTTDEVMLKWRTGEETDVTGSPDVVGYDVSYSRRNYIVNAGERRFSTVELEVHITRLLTEFFFHVYVPLLLSVIASWIPFWLDPDSLGVRLAIAIATTATALCQLNLNRHLYVEPGYPTALDVWTAVCCVFLFTALAENLYIWYTRRRGGSAVAGSADDDFELKTRPRSDEEKKTSGNNAVVAAVLSKFTGQKKSMDLTARLLFPSLYILFHVVSVFYIIMDPAER